MSAVKKRECIVLRHPGMCPLPETFRTKAGARTLRTDVRLIAESGDLVRDWALADNGLAFRPICDVAADIAANRLVPLFADHPSTEADIHVVYPTRQFLLLEFVPSSTPGTSNSQLMKREFWPTAPSCRPA
jgi:DNA-binding transcriptional LysR family regulator